MSILSRTRVLVIDDEAEMVDLISLMLRDKNIDILTALNGRSGLQMALRQKPDVILTDLMMPEIDGFTLMEQVLKGMPQVPVIVITAYGSMNTAIRALRLGAFDFLLKPLGPESVKAAVAKAAGQQLSKKVQTWRQRITSALSGSRDPDHIAGQFLSLTAQALGAEHGLIWWPEPPPPPCRSTPMMRPCTTR
ncbi:MAG: response regulator [Anaerolineae bacterium]